ncbi:MAG: hypothetical protein KAR79_01495, partial [Simkaniaceae bacterium]|nr:hypothetical protein [Simkaniaceae bacterium]
MLKKIIIFSLCLAVHSVESKESILLKIHKRPHSRYSNIAKEQNIEEKYSRWSSGYEFIAGHR